MVEDSGKNIGDFEYTRRFFCRALPTQLDDNDSPTLIIQSYYVHQDNYALRVRLKTKSVRIAMTPDLDPLAVLEKYRDEFRLGSVTVKGPSKTVSPTGSMRTAGTSTCSEAPTLP